MGFGFFGKYQTKNTFVSSGLVYSSNTRRQISLRTAPLEQLGDGFNPHIIEYSAANTGSNPSSQFLISATEVAYNNSDFRARSNAGAVSSFISNPILSFFLTAQANAARGFSWASNAALSPVKTINTIFQRPELVKFFSISQTNAAGDLAQGTYPLPFFINCEHICFSGNTVAITAITGKWPHRLKYFVYHNQSILNSIEHKFPETLEGLCLPGSTTLAAAATINNLISDCVNLKYLLLCTEVTSDSNAIALALNGALDITNSPLITALQIISTNVTNITYSLTSLTNLVLRGCTSLNATTFLNLLDVFLSTTGHTFLYVGLCNRTISRTFVDTDFKSTLTQFYIQGNIITGNLTLTTSNSNLTRFATGANDTAVANASKNNFAIVNVTGLTHATFIDLSNSRITDLQLPVNTVCRTLYLGGNLLDIVTNPNLLNQVKAMTALEDLRFSHGAAGTSGTNAGQNSTNGLGTNPDFSPLTSLTTLVANSCKMTGLIKFHSSIQGANFNDNNLTGIDTGSLTNLTVLRANDNPSFDLDFTRVTAIQTVTVSSTGITIFDISNRTSTSTIGSISIQTASLLTTITLPANSANAVLINSGTPHLSISNNPLLTSITNLENLSYASLTGNARNIALFGNALNQTFPFGVNNFLPSAIQVQNNGMSTANVDATITNVYTNRTKWNGTSGARSLNIGGTNAAATGTYQAPAGFVLGVSDGTPASVKEMAYVLVNNYAWTITMN